MKYNTLILSKKQVGFSKAHREELVGEKLWPEKILKPLFVFEGDNFILSGTIRAIKVEPRLLNRP